MPNSVPSRFCTFFLCLLMPLSAVSDNTPTQSTAQTYHLKKAEIIDSSGFEKPMTAVTVLVPVGWKSEGGIVWNVNPPCGQTGTSVQWRAVAPDTQRAVEFISARTWSSNNLPVPLPPGTCPLLSITNVRQFLEYLVQQERPNARILDFRERPDLTVDLQGMNKTEPSPGGETQTWVQGGEILIGYQQGGVEMREAIAAIATFYLTRMAGVFPGEIREFLVGSAVPSFAMRAPNGQLNFNLMETIRLSAKANPQWVAKMNAHNAKMGQIAAKGAADRAAITAQTNREINDIIVGGEKKRQAIRDKGHREFSEYIRGVETYHDPSQNEQVELPNTYDNAWRLNDDTYVLTDDPNFNPNATFGIDGRKLEAAP